MTEQQDFQSLDELFRNTFNNLPETPAPNGWDMPSEQVWTQVQQAIPVKKPGGWSTLNTLIVAGAITVAAGLWYVLSRPPAPEIQPAVVPAMEAPVQSSPEVPAPVQKSATPGVSTPATTAKSRHILPKIKTGTNPKVQPAVTVPTPETGRVPFNNDQIRRPDPVNTRSEATPLPGTKPAKEARNNSELLWQTPIAPLPTVIERNAAKKF